VSEKAQQLSEISKLQALLTSFKSASEKATNPLSNAFDLKKTSVKSTDVNNPDRYLNARISNSFLVEKASYDVEVTQVAKAAEIVIGDNITSRGLPKADAGLNGTMELTVNGQQRDITINNHDSVEAIIKSINTAFRNNDNKFEASIINDSVTDTSYISVRSLELGKTPTIALSWQGGGSPVKAVSDIKGSNAEVLINGARVESVTNKLEDLIPGMTVNLEAVNANGKVQTISIEPDTSGVRARIEEVGNIWNELSQFVAKHKQTKGTYDQFADPFSPQGSRKAETAVLYGNPLLKEAEEMLESFITTSQESNSKIKSIFDMGFSLGRSKPSDEYPAEARILEINKEDLQKLENAFADNFEEVRKLFVNTTTIKGDPANNSYIAVTRSETISGNIAGKDIKLEVVVDGAGTVTSVKAKVPGRADITGTYANNSINFAGTELEGIAFYYDIGSANTNTEKFTFNSTNGIINKGHFLAREMINDNGTTGSAIVAAEQIQTQKNSITAELARLQEELDAATEKADATLQAIEVQEMQNKMGMMAIEALLGNDK